METNSRETSPEPGKKKSRRKPTVTRKITDDIDKIDAEGDTSFDFLPEANTEKKEENDQEHFLNGDSNEAHVNKDKDEPSPKDENSKEDFIIPEGTVIVQPEAVDEPKKEEYKGPEWKATKRLSRSVALGITQCTACNKQINTNNTGAARRHPVLKVLICKRCYSWYASAEIEQDSDGMDEQCRWCGDGGNLICCDFCNNAFCKSCIKKNLGRKELSDIVDADDKAKWRCYVCDPKPLANLIADCTSVLQAIDKENQKKDGKKDAVQTPKSQQNRTAKQSQVAKKSTTPGKHTGGDNRANQAKPNTAMTVNTPTGTVVLPPGAIPVKTVINQAGNQVIVLQQPTGGNRSAQKPSNPARNTGIKSNANETQMKIISNAVKNVSAAMAKSKTGITPQKRPQEVKTVKAPIVRYEWDAPINEYNVGQALDRTLAVTESLRMVMVSLKDDMKKANAFPVQQCLEKKRIVAAKIRRAMGAFKKQVLDIEQFCKTTAKMMPKSQKVTPSKHDRGAQQQKGKPFPVSLLKNQSPGKTLPKAKKDVEVIELSDSSDDESKSSTKKNNEKDSPKSDKDTPNKEKKGFQLKLRLGGTADSLGTNGRKRKHSADGNTSDEGSEKENEDHNKEASSPEEKKVPEKRQRKSSEEEDERQAESDKEEPETREEGETKQSVKEKKTEEKDEVVVEGEAVNKETADIIGDSESDSEVKEVKGGDGDKSEEVKEEDKSNLELEKDVDAMETEDSVVEGDVQVDSKTEDQKEEEDDTKDCEEDEVKEVSKPTAASSESESDSEVTELSALKPEVEASSPAAEEVEDQTAETADQDNVEKESPPEEAGGDEDIDESNINEDELLGSDNDEDNSKAEAMDAESSELRDSKLSSDGEKMECEQLDGSKDTKKKKKQKAEDDDQDGDLGFDVNGKSKREVRKLPLRSGGRSRNDIEAQRELHRELLEDSSDDEGDQDNEETKMEEDQLSSDSSGSESPSGDAHNDADYLPKEAKGKKAGHKRTAERQSKHNKTSEKVPSKKFRRFGEKPEDSKKTRKSKRTKKTESEQESSPSDTEVDNSSKKRGSKKSEKSVLKSRHSKSKKTKEDTDSEDDKPVSKRTSKSKKKEVTDSEDDKPLSKRTSRTKKKEVTDSEDDKPLSKRTSKTKVSQKTRKKEAEESDDSSKKDNSTDYDSELEKDIEKLARAPAVTSKKGTSKSKGSDQDTSSNRGESKRKKEGKKLFEKKSSKKGKVEDLSSGEESDVEEEVDEAEEEADLQSAGEKALAALEEGFNFSGNENNSDDENEKARQELFADDSPASSDSDVDEMLAKKLEKKSGKEKSKSKSREESEAEMEESQDDEEVEESEKDKSKKKAFGKNKLLDAVLSDSEEDFDIRPSKKKRGDESSNSEASQDEEADEDKELLSDVSSDFDVGPKKKVSKGKKKKKSSSESESNSDSDSDKQSKGKKGKKGKKAKRKRIKVDTDSDEQKKSGESEENSDDDGKANKRKKIRKLIKDKKLSVDTKSAAKAEEERRKRIADRQKLYNQVDEEDVNSPTKNKITTKLVLEMDEEKKPIIEVNSDLIRKLKPHQVEAVRFMWDCCVETLDRAKKEEGAGCILAHCMGLGKTLSVITFVHTLMRNAELTGVNTCLIVCPLNTVLNWQREFGHWIEDDEQLTVDELTSVKDNYARCNMLDDWHKTGGCMIMGYEMYRNLSSLRNIKKAKQKKIVTASLVDPGPDLVVCDEGHILKNDASALSKAMSSIRTKRRIALTGTPLQNNLVEYHCMVDFVKPKLLGTRKEFMNRFVNPIKNGQCSDSSDHDVKLMKKRAHILHETLAGCVQRRDYSALTKFLPPKHEYVISVRLAEVQMELYEKYLNRVGAVPVEGEKIKGAKLFSDYQVLMRIWTHPWVLKLQEIREEMKKVYNDTDEEDSFIDDSDDDSFIESQSSSSEQEEESVQEVSSDSDAGGRRRSRRMRNSKEQTNGGKKGSEVVKSWKTKSRGGGDTDSVKTTASNESDKKTGEDDPVSLEWWAEHLSEGDKFNLEVSGKMVLLYEVLKMCENIGDKVLVFSQSLLSLDLVEDFLDHWDKGDSETEPATTMGWSKGVDYFRMDGSTTAQNRKAYANTFNDPENVRARLFLISTKAGSLGTNLVGANRVIIFDASWNPSHDTQSIFRVYRFGQTKPVYIYRFLAQGTMEEKIYERQVTKQSLSQRVVDEHQVERHFTNADLSELYNFKPERFDENKDYLPVLPKDMMLAELLTEKKQWIVKYHEHDSLLENKIEEDLTEEERKAAWEEFELEKKHGFRPAVRQIMPAPGQSYNYNNINTQYARGASNMYMPPPQFSVKEIEELAKAIYAANPGINQVELQMRVQAYVSKQHQMYQQRQREQMMHEMARLRHYQDERIRQEQALQAAYNKAQQQGTSSGNSSATSLLRSLVSSGQSSATNQDDVVEVTKKS